MPNRLSRRRRAAVSADAESGQSLVLIAISMALFFAIAAFVFDAAQLAVAHHQAQVAADAGAMAAAQDMETTSLPQSQVDQDGKAAAIDNVPSSNVVITESDAGDLQAEADVTAPVELPFGSMFGLGSGSVSAHAVAQVNTAVTDIDGTILSVGCGNTTQSNCTYNQGVVIPTGTSAATDGWQVTSKAEEPTDGYKTNGYPAGEPTVNLQTCQGSQGSGQCYDPNSNAPETSDDEVVDLNGESEGGMFQTVSTVPFARYVLTFWLTGNPALNGWPGPSNNSFPLDVYITSGKNNPYTPAYSEGSAPQGPCSNYQPSSGFITCWWKNYHDDVCGASGVTLQCQTSGQEEADFSEESLTFTATSYSTTITFNSETYDDDAMDGSTGKGWYYCGPEVAEISFGPPEIQLTQ